MRDGLVLCIMRLPQAGGRMQATEQRSGDLAKPRALAWCEPHAEQRDRLLAVVKAIEGRETLAIAEALSRSRAFVQRWVVA